MKNKNPFDKEAIEVMEILGLAKTKKTIWTTTDKHPPLALHYWLKIPKGTIIGLIDSWELLVPSPSNSAAEVIERFWFHSKIRAYVNNNNHFHLVTVDFRDLKDVKKV